jgi:hypothetical protein
MVARNRRGRTRGWTPIDELLEYWIDISKRPILRVKDFALFFQKAEATFNHFADFYRWSRPKDVESDKFLSRIYSTVRLKDEYLRATTGSPHPTSSGLCHERHFKIVLARFPGTQASIQRIV